VGVWIFFGTSGNTLTSVTQSNYTSSTTPTAITLGVGGSFYSSGYSANASNSGANQSAAIHITGGGNSPTITHNWFNLLPGAAVRIDSGQGMYFRENTVDTVGYGLLGSLANVQSQDNQFFNCFIDCISNTVGTTSMNSINFMSTGDSMQQSNQFGDGFALSDSTYIPVGTDSLVDWCTIKNVFMRNYFNAMVLKGLKGCVISGNIARNGGTALSVTNSDHNTFSDLHIAGQEGATLAPYIALSGTQANIFNNVSTFNVTTDYVNYNITGAALTDFTLNTWLGDAFNPGAVTNNQGFVFTAEQNLPSGSLSVTSLLRKNALIHTDDSNEATPAITVNGLTTPAKTLALGYDTTKNQAYVQAYWNDVGTSPVALNPGGGDVLVATSTDCGSALCVFGNSVLTGYGKATNFISTAQAAISGTDCLQIDVSGYIANSGSPCSAVSSHTGTTGTITGTALAATCDSGTAGVTGAVVGHPVMVSSTTGVDVGGTFNVRGSVTSTGVVTVYVCGTGTPASLAYNVTVF